MAFSPPDSPTSLQRLAHHLAGEFENQQQAIADPVWYVHLRLWHQPLPHLCDADHIYFYAEQASLVRLEYPYRPRIFCLTAPDRATPDAPITVRYAMLNETERWRGGGTDPDRLREMAPTDFQFLEGCTLAISPGPSPDLEFQARPDLACRCCFTIDGQIRQVSLGFDAGRDRFNSYDKGIDPDTGKNLWGAIMGPFQFSRRQDFRDHLGF